MIKKKSKPVILVSGLVSSSFFNEDLSILSEDYKVEVVIIKNRNQRTGHWYLFKLVGQLFWLLKNIRQADIIYGWFVDYHMFLPVLFAKMTGKPVVISLGGYDCSNVPEYKYGVFYSKWRKPLAKYVYRRTDVLLPVTYKLIESKNNYTLWPEESTFGLKKHLPKLKARIIPLATGYDPGRWPLQKKKRERQVCTVAYMNSDSSVFIKGIDIFIKTAARLPDVKFLLVGVTNEYKKHIYKNYQVPDNIMMQNPVNQKDLVSIYNESSVYVQLSRLEGLPNVVCEAMLSGCIPVGSNVFGITEIIGDAGYIVRTPQAEEVADTIKIALNSDYNKRLKARERTIDRYAITKRKESLKKLIRELLS